uniref:HDC16020 n=1 Tax=Drosophila melanogaster TaxID=7227 RepID=Q6IJ41_DROME|nr:TPA_inf: HDC16020 [Drosophila melanogaster]
MISPLVLQLPAEGWGIKVLAQGENRVNKRLMLPLQLQRKVQKQQQQQRHEQTLAVARVVMVGSQYLHESHCHWQDITGKNEMRK